MKNIFISYHFRDASFKGEIKTWLDGAGHYVKSTDEKDLRPEGENAVERQIKADLKNSDHILVLVGNDSHNRPWINYEISVAKNYGIPIHWVRLPNRTGGAPPEVRNIPGLNYSRAEILNAVR